MQGMQLRLLIGGVVAVGGLATVGVYLATHRGSHPNPVPPTPPVPPAEPGVVVADAARTPGTLNPAVTQATIGATICQSGYTATVRPFVKLYDASQTGTDG